MKMGGTYEEPRTSGDTSNYAELDFDSARDGSTNKRNFFADSSDEESREMTKKILPEGQNDSVKSSFFFF